VVVAVCLSVLGAAPVVVGVVAAPVVVVVVVVVVGAGVVPVVPVLPVAVLGVVVAGASVGLVAVEPDGSVTVGACAVAAELRTAPAPVNTAAACPPRRSTRRSMLVGEAALLIE
jgi:hypothetical protein